MFVHDTGDILECAAELEAAADRLDRAADELERRLLAQRRQARRLIFFKKPEGDLEDLAARRRELSGSLRTQSLFLKECVRRYRGAQSRSVMRAGTVTT